jgi:hypothetical protein
MLTLKPRGRGNWRPLVITIIGDRASPLLIRPGQLLTLGGVVFRICTVSP